MVRGDLGSNILAVLVHKRQILGPQVECSDLESSNLISRPVRQVYYGLLLGQGGDGVMEVDRVGGELDSSIPAASEQSLVITEVGGKRRQGE